MNKLIPVELTPCFKHVQACWRKAISIENFDHQRLITFEELHGLACITWNIPTILMISIGVLLPKVVNSNCTRNLDAVCSRVNQVNLLAEHMQQHHLLNWRTLLKPSYVPIVEAWSCLIIIGSKVI